MSEGKSTSKWRRWSGMIAAGLLLFIVTVHSVWSVIAKQHFSRMVQAIHDRGEPILPGDFSRPLPDPKTDASADIEAAVSLANTSAPAWTEFEKHDLETYRGPLTDTQKKVVNAFETQIGPMIQRLDAASGKQTARPPITMMSPVVTMPLPMLNSCRLLSTSLMGKAIAEHDRGEDALALRRLEENMLVGKYADSYPWIVGHLVAVAVHTRGSLLAQQLAPTLQLGTQPGQARPEDFHRLIDAFLNEEGWENAFRRSMQGERMFQVDFIDDMAHAGKAAGLISMPMARMNPAIRYLLTPITYANGDRMLTYMNSIIAVNLKNNWPATAAKMPTIVPTANVTRYYYFISESISPSLNRVAETHFRALADRRIAAIALAVRWYALEHNGKLPATLQELVPTYLPSVPLDPMSIEDHPFGYRGERITPMVYSVGADGKDDGGDETFTNPRFATQPNISPWLKNDYVIPLYPLPPSTQPADDGN